MLKHVVAWNFKAENKAENLLRMKQLLDELPGLIPEILSYEVGINISVSEQARDLVLISAFADQAALQRYTVHAEHQRVVAALRQVSQKTVVVDYLS